MSEKNKKKTEEEISEVDVLKLSSDNANSGSSGDSAVFMRLYSSLMIILMTFFIVLVSLSKVSTEKFQALKEGIDNSFGVFGVESKRGQEMLLNSIANMSRKFDNKKLINNTANDGTMDTQEDAAGQTDKETDIKETDIVDEKIIRGEGEKKGGGESKEEGNTGRSDKQEAGQEDYAKYEGDSGEEIDTEEVDGKKVAEKDKFLEDGYTNFIIVVSSEMIFLGGEVERKGRELVIRFPSDKVFYPGDIKIKKDIIPVFERIITLLEQQEFAKITVRCFSSDEPIEEFKTFTHLGFSCLRAKNVNRIFYKNGIALDKVQNVGYGNSRHSESKLENNLVEIIIN